MLITVFECAALVVFPFFFVFFFRLCRLVRLISYAICISLKGEQSKSNEKKNKKKRAETGHRPNYPIISIMVIALVSLDATDVTESFKFNQWHTHTHCVHAQDIYWCWILIEFNSMCWHFCTRIKLSFVLNEPKPCYLIAYSGACTLNTESIIVYSNLLRISKIFL